MSDVARKWFPVEWLDEMNPLPLESPDAFIEREGDGWCLRLPEGDSDRENDFYHMTVVPGQVVGFEWTESYGDLTMTVHEDRTFTLDRAIPEGATHFYEHSEGMLTNSLSEMVEGADRLEPGEYEISAYTWSDAIPHRFDVDADGNGHFTPSAGAN